ncbi:MAG: hypothetical protein DBX42_09135 [Azospirillum sp.]|nr:MAG: hypothetical protein DBX42_09135 [Azospirillum sp.]
MVKPISVSSMLEKVGCFLMSSTAGSLSSAKRLLSLSSLSSSRRVITGAGMASSSCRTSTNGVCGSLSVSAVPKLRSRAIEKGSLSPFVSGSSWGRLRCLNGLNISINDLRSPSSVCETAAKEEFSC